jgi:phosphatidylserine/phosphatidylglycerophosphate/cardiolipin synthase-like enzyme
MRTKIEEALSLAMEYGQTDGDHHKMWVIDQMVRKLCGSAEEYDRFVTKHNDGEDGPDTYCWDEGIAP